MMINRLQHFLEETPEATQFTDYCEIEALGDTYIVALSTALYIERHLDDVNEPGWLEFHDVFGARHRLPARTVYRITESTREARAALRAFERARRCEEDEDKDPLEDLK
jgi:DNA-binding PadR family transcriptional regulator